MIKRIISAFLTGIMLFGAVSCGKTENTASESGSFSNAEAYLIERFGIIPDDVVLGDSGTAAAYGVDMTDFEDEGYIVRTVGESTLVLGKTEDGLDRAVRYYANHISDTDAPADKVYGEGERVDSFTVCGRDISEYVITVTEAHPEGSYPKSTAYAATELASVIKQACGVVVPVVKESSLTEGVPYIRLTCDGTGANGDEGFTVTVNEDGCIEILGGLERGCLFAAYDIGERWLGVRYLAGDYTYIYEADSINITPEDSYSDAPGMELRYPASVTRNPGLPGFADFTSFKVKNKLNGGINKEIYGYDAAPTVHHGLYKLWETGSMDPNRCFTDEDVYDEVMSALEQRLDAAKKSGDLYVGNYYSISLGQNDSNSFCHCESCLALNRAEGANSGAYVHFVKSIADHFAEEYPTVMFGMFAYYGTEEPPKVTKLPDNVNVEYCIVGACYCGPLDGSECREERRGLSGFTVAEEKENLVGWMDVTKNLDVRLYFFAESIGTPYNTIDNLQKDISYLYGLGVRRLFIEIQDTAFAYDYPGTWLLCKLMWNPTMSEEEYSALRDEVMRLWYGEGYTYIIEQLEYYDSMLMCTDRGFWGADIDYIKCAAVSEIILWYFDKAADLADSAFAEKNVRLISAHAIYNTLCAWYDSKYVNGTAEDKAEYESLCKKLQDIFELSGATYIDFWQKTPIKDIDFTADPKEWRTVNIEGTLP